MYWVIPCFCLILVLHVIKFTIPTCFYVYFISHLYTPRSLHIIQQQLLPHVTVSATYPTIVTAVLTSSYFSMDVACAFIFWLLFLSFVYLLIRQTNHLLVYRKQYLTFNEYNFKHWYSKLYHGWWNNLIWSYNHLPKFCAQCLWESR